jgi:hypothetical protein
MCKFENVRMCGLAVQSAHFVYQHIIRTFAYLHISTFAHFYSPNIQANTSGATIVASLSMMNFGV